MEEIMDEAEKYIMQDIDAASNQSACGSDDLEDYSLPSWAELKQVYNAKWIKEKIKFINKLKYNFQDLLSSNRSGKQEIYIHTIRNNKTKLYEKAFRELFHDPNYGASVGEIETLAGKRVKRLFIVLPEPW